MRVSFYSVLMSVVWCDLLILLIYFLRRRLWFVRAFGSHSLIVLYVGCALRLLLGFELEAAVEIPVRFFNPVATLLMKTVPLGPRSIPIKTVLLSVWLLVGLAAMAQVFRKHRRFWKAARSFPEAGEEVKRCLSQIVDSRDSEKLRAVVSSQIGSPFLTGCFQGTVCLPDRNWKKRELLCVLQHEAAHFKHHDEFTYLLADLFCAFFWWNPCAYLLRRCVKEILEYRADEEVVRGRKPSDVRYYCMTLIEFAGTETSIAPSFAASKLECRVARIMDKPFAKAGKVLSGATLLLTAAVLFLVSYCIIFQSYFVADVEPCFILEDRISAKPQSECELVKLREILPAEYSGGKL